MKRSKRKTKKRNKRRKSKRKVLDTVAQEEEIAVQTVEVQKEAQGRIVVHNPKRDQDQKLKNGAKNPEKIAIEKDLYFYLTHS